VIDARRISELYALGDDAVLSDGPVARGEQAEVWRLQTTRGRWAVRVPFAPESEHEVREDAAFQDTARDAGVPSPAVIRTVAGDVLADAGSAWVRVYEWIDVAEADTGLDPAAVGSLVAALHQVEFTGVRGTDPWYTDPIGAAEWDRVIAALHAAGAPFAAGLAGFRDELLALEGLIVPAGSLRTCHRDLWADNLRSTPGGGLCLIDWDNCGAADPSQELAGVLFEFWQGDPARAAELYAAYLRSGGPGRITAPESFSMTVAQLGHIGHISCVDWLDPEASEAERAHSAERVAEFLGHPLSRSVIADLVAAVG
jgi:Ser/Thr protein kinase RdoA (MazF antagonist)